MPEGACSSGRGGKRLPRRPVTLIGRLDRKAESHKEVREHHKLQFMLVTDDGLRSEA